VLKAAAQMANYRDPTRIKYLKLVDGGVTDNLGLATIAVTRAILDTPYAPMTERDAVKVRRMLFIVVDASRAPGGDWALSEIGPGGVDLAVVATDVATNAAARFAADGFGIMVREWRESLVRFRCALTDEQVVHLGGPSKGWNCDDVKFYLAFLTVDRLEPEYRDKLNAIPTRLTLTPQQVDDSIEAGRRGALALRRLQQYIRERVGH
jgi:NTE family protein